MDQKIDIKLLEDIYQDIKLFSLAGKLYNERIKKNNQIIGYIKLIEAALQKMSFKKRLILLDCGCGKSYLSFLLYKYFHELIDRKIHVIGIDNNQKLVDECNNIKEKLNFKHMEFHAGDIINFSFDKKIDLSYSLHACNWATDQTIAKGVMENARVLFSVSCCQHTNRKKFRCSTLRSVSRYKDYKERLVDMFGDTMRGLLLEAIGYKVGIFEFVSASETPKNIVLRAQRNYAKKKDQEVALLEYKKLVEFTNIKLKLQEYLKEKLMKLDNYHLIVE